MTSNQIIEISEAKSVQISEIRGQLSFPTVEAQTGEPTLPHLIDKVADMAIANKDAGLIIATAVGTSVVLYVVVDAAAKLIRAVRSGNQKRLQISIRAYFSWF